MSKRQNQKKNAKRAAKQTSSFKIMTPVELFEHYQKNLPSTAQSSPIACSVIMGAFLQNALQTLLCRYFIEGSTSRNLFDYPQPLSSFSACIDVAYVLGFYDSDMRHNLTNIRLIRNAFAHSNEALDFATPKIVKLIDELKLPKMTIKHADVIKPDESHPLHFKNVLQDNKQTRFVFLANALFLFLWNKSREVERCKVQMIWNKSAQNAFELAEPFVGAHDTVPLYAVASMQGESIITSETVSE